MPRTLVIQDKVVIGDDKSCYGEFNRKDSLVDSIPLTFFQRQNTLERLLKRIYCLMNEAEKSHQSTHSEADRDYVTRLSTPEFYFYTKEPLTLSEFQELQNNIYKKAVAGPPGVQLILSSFAVKTAHNLVMNVTAHITYGRIPTFHFVIKNHTSSQDIHYHENDDNFLAHFDSTTTSPLPTIRVHDMDIQFTLNNIIETRTPSDAPFLTAVDICLDHLEGVAENRVNKLVRSIPVMAKRPLSHVVVSNGMSLYKNNSLESKVLLVDAQYSERGCIKGLTQNISGTIKAEPQGFSLGTSTIFDVEPHSIPTLEDSLREMSQKLLDKIKLLATRFQLDFLEIFYNEKQQELLHANDWQRLKEIHHDLFVKHYDEKHKGKIRAHCLQILQMMNELILANLKSASILRICIDPKTYTNISSNKPKDELDDLRNQLLHVQKLSQLKIRCLKTLDMAKKFAISNHADHLLKKLEEQQEELITYQSSRDVKYLDEMLGYLLVTEAEKLNKVTHNDLSLR